MSASPGCWALFTRRMADEYNDRERWPVHALTVDTYAVQHPGAPSLKAARRVGMHLLGICLVVERDLPLERAASIRHAAADRLAEGFVWLEPPARWGLTIEHLTGAENAEDYRRRVREWAGDVWGAWSPHHETVRRWIDWLVAASPPDFALGS